MAMSTCTKCGNTQFEVKEVSPGESNFKFNFIQCTSCGGVIGVLDYFNIGELIHQLAEELKVPFRR